MHFILTDTFNQRELSKHRSIENAVKAREKHARAVVRANGPGHYVWYSITASDESDISEEVTEAEMAHSYSKYQR